MVELLEKENRIGEILLDLLSIISFGLISRRLEDFFEEDVQECPTKAKQGDVEEWLIKAKEKKRKQEEWVGGIVLDILSIISFGLISRN
jgi:hypothetical protein